MLCQRFEWFLIIRNWLYIYCVRYEFFISNLLDENEDVVEIVCSLIFEATFAIHDVFHFFLVDGSTVIIIIYDFIQ